jgi:ubiquinone/menaquinone biosynthesis C-methylase UbiE
MKANLTNVEFITDDVNHITQYDLSPDLIYSRLLLIHQEDPLTTLENYRHILKPRGLLVCEEPITSHSFAYPNNPAFKEHLRLYTALGKINQRNFDLGNVLPEFFQQKALTILKYRKVINTFSNSSAKKIAYLRTKECADKYLSLNLIDSNRLEKLLGHLQAFYKDKNSCCSGVEMVQIIGRK